MGDRKEKELEKLVYEHTTLFFADKDAPFYPKRRGGTADH